MACIRKRRGKWVVDYRDGAGIRRWATCRTKREAETVLAEKLRETRQPIRPAVDPNITVASYAERWLDLVAASVKQRSVAIYRYNLNLHLLPVFGSTRVYRLHRGRIKTLLAEKLRSGLARRTVQLLHATLRGMLNAAVDDGVILANPADKLERQLRLTSSTTARQEEIKAMSREQLSRFLSVAAHVAPRVFALFLLLARTGIRLGEVLVLQWEDVNFPEREIRVVRGLSGGRIDETPKSGHGRTVDMSQQLARVLQRLQVERKAETLKRGWKEVPPWVFCSTVGTRLDRREVGKTFKRVLKAAGLPLHFTPHSLRHTYASLLLQAGVSPVYVQRQLGHSSIKITVDLYGRWLPMSDKAAVDRLDETSGSKTVAKAGRASSGISELSDFIEEIDGVRGQTATIANCAVRVTGFRRLKVTTGHSASRSVKRTIV